MAVSGQMSPRGRIFPGYLLLLVAAVGGVASAQNATTTKDVEEATLQSVPARSWIVDAAKNELEALHHTDSYLRYRTHTVSEKAEVVRDVVESKDGTVARLIMRDGKPLTEEQDQGERQRLKDMIASPSTYSRLFRSSDVD